MLILKNIVKKKKRKKKQQKQTNNNPHWKPLVKGKMPMKISKTMTENDKKTGLEAPGKLTFCWTSYECHDICQQRQSGREGLQEQAADGEARGQKRSTMSSADLESKAKEWRGGGQGKSIKVQQFWQSWIQIYWTAMAEKINRRKDKCHYDNSLQYFVHRECAARTK